MTILDTNIPHKKLLMVIARKTIQKEIPLKKGYSYVEYTDDLFDAWCKLHVETHLFESMDQAKKALQDMLDTNREQFIKQFIFVVNANNELVGSAGLWDGMHFGMKRTRIHYVSVSLQAQHQKIAQAMVSKLCMMYDQNPNKYPLYLSTQTQSYGAIAMYSRLGFTPYLGAYEGHTQKQSEKDWEFATKILKEKTIKH